MPSEPTLPTTNELVVELQTLREAGLPRVETVVLPALRAVARGLITDEAAETHVVIESLLRRAVERLGGGKYGEAASLLFGLDQGSRTLTAGVRRTRAAEAYGRSLVTFRKSYEANLLRQLAAQMLGLYADQRSLEARRQFDPSRPAESALSLHWIEVFQAYYRIWSPLYGLANDLSAYSMTLFEKPRPYDRRFGTKGPNDEGYSQEEQAEGYASFALYHYAHFEWQLQRFANRFGGMWMLSHPASEQAAADAIHLISWNIQPFNERDQSFLRTVVDETPNQELDRFLTCLAGSDRGQLLHREWQNWAAACSCDWDPNLEYGTEYFPTYRTHAGISEHCALHQVVAACAAYCKLIDEDWQEIADWYHLSEKIKPDIDDSARYAYWRRTPHGAGYDAQ